MKLGILQIYIYIHTALENEGSLSGTVDSDAHFLWLFFESFDIVDQGVLDCELFSLSLPVSFRHAYFQCRAYFTLRFKRSCGFGKPWTCGWKQTSRSPVEHNMCCFSFFHMV